VPAGARAHARAEPVGAGALALLGLVGALHEVKLGGEGERLAPRAEGTRRRSIRRPEDPPNPFLA
jgi:hypothetical protein